MADIIESWETEADGMRYRVALVPDYESSPDDYDGYPHGTREAFRRGEWQFVGVIVTPILDGPAEGMAGAGQFSGVTDASLWSVEWGTMPGCETDHGECNATEDVVIDRAFINRYPVPDLISEVRGQLRQLREALSGLALDDCPARHLRTEGIPEPFTVRCERAAGHAPPHRVMEYEWETAPDCDVCQTTAGCRCNAD
jgi:hypothetical protein